MRRRDFELNYWPSVADFMLALFILAIATGALTLIVQRLQTMSRLGGTMLTQTTITIDRKRELESAERERDKLRRVIQLLEGEAKKREAELEAAQKEKDTLEGTVESLNVEVKKHGKPPIIVIADADRFNFISGSAKIEAPFRTALQRKHFPELLRTIELFPTVDTVEIIGHTDSSKVAGSSNLDRELVRFIKGQIPLSGLTPGSNADLGLLRALAVRAEWRAWLQSSGTRLPRFVNVRCYSAANSAPADPGKLGVEQDNLSRRTEIRFTQLKP